MHTHISVILLLRVLHLQKYAFSHMCSYLLRQYVDSNLIAIGLCPEFHLGKHLVGKGVAHYKARVASSTTKVHQSALRQQQDMLPIRELITIHLMGKR